MEKESEVKKEITTTELIANAVMAKAPFPQFFFLVLTETYRPMP